MELALDVLLNPDDNVLVPKPGFAIYETISKSRGHEVRHYNLLVGQSLDIIFIVKKKDKKLSKKGHLSALWK